MVQEMQIFVVSFSRYGAITFLRIFDFNNNSYVVLFGFVGGIDILAVFQIQIVAWLINYYFCFCLFSVLVANTIQIVCNFRNGRGYLTSYSVLCSNCNYKSLIRLLYGHWEHGALTFPLGMKYLAFFDA